MTITNSALTATRTTPSSTSASTAGPEDSGANRRPTVGSVLAVQDQVIHRRQALAAGMTRGEWAWKIKRDWRSPLPGVAVAHTGRLTQRQLMWVAVLWAGKDAELAGVAGLVHLGFTPSTFTVIHVVIPWQRKAKDVVIRNGKDRHSVKVHRMKDKSAWSRRYLDLPVLKAQVCTILAAAWAGTDREAEWRIAASVQQQLTAPVTLRAVLAKMPSVRRHALIAEVLDDVEFGAHAASELDFLQFLRDHDLPLPDELNVKVRANGIKFLDAPYRKKKLSFEVDGAHHREVRQWDADVLRTLEIVADDPDHRVIRITRGNMRHDGPRLAKLMAQLLAA